MSFYGVSEGWSPDDDGDGEDYRYGTDLNQIYSLFSQHYSNGRAAQSEKKFRVAKQCYDKAKEAMETLLSRYGSPELLNNYAALSVRLSVVELQLGNVRAAKTAVEESLQCHPTAEAYESRADIHIALAGSSHAKTYPHLAYQYIYTAMEDFVSSYKSKPNTLVYCRALIFAVNNGLTVMLPSRSDFTEVIDKLLAHNHVRLQHLEFLLLHNFTLPKKKQVLPNAGMAIGKCKTSSIKLGSLLQRFELSFSFIKALIQHGTQPCPNSIEYAICHNDYRLFHYLTKSYSGSKNSNFAFLDASILISKFDKIDLELFQTILKKGCIALGINPKVQPPLLCAIDKERYDIAAVLIECGANLLEMQFAKYTTVVHEATKIALHTGKIIILKQVLDAYKLPDDGKLVDNRSQLPHHIVVTANNNHSKEILELLCGYHFDLTTRDHNNQTALDSCRKKRDHLKVILEAVSNPNRVSSGMGEVSEPKDETPPVTVSKLSDKVVVDTTTKSAKSAVTKSSLKSSVTHKDEDPKEDLQSSPVKTSLAQIEAQAKSMVEEILQNTDEFFKVCLDAEAAANDVSTSFTGEGNEGDTSFVNPASGNDENPQALDAIETLNVGLFQNCAWEVECTEIVWKTLSKLAKPLRKVIFERIHCLAKGEWHHEFHSSVNHKRLHLYKLQLPGDICIIWELAIAYSPRCTQTRIPSSTSDDSTKTLFTEIIRIWSIVLNPNYLDAYIKQIEVSHARGQQSAVVQKLLPNLLEKKLPDSTKERIPRYFHAVSEYECSNLEKFYPPASSKESEYNIVTFYPVTDEFLFNLLNNDNPRRDFLFKVCQEEHDIINVNQDESILLLGRSGTGKTTCCLYRLWNQFREFWEVSDEPRIIRKPLIKPILYEPEVEEEAAPVEDDGIAVDDHDAEIMTNSISSQEEDRAMMRVSFSSEQSSDAVSLSQDVFYDNNYTDRNVTLKFDDDAESWPDDDFFDEDDDIDESENTILPDPCNDDVVSIKEDHLQQVFITKNSVLCAQFKKKFFDLAHTVPKLSKHLEYEDIPYPNTLQEIIPHAYPLFLTFRDWLELLDASLEDDDCFFVRNPDGSLAVEIIDMDYNYDKSIEALVMLDESSSEDEDEANDGLKQPSLAHVHKLRKVDANYFIETMWPAISKEMRVSHPGKLQIKPILVWMEIKSFIKGSSQSLKSPNGCLSLTEYQNFGKKMAPNFAYDRTTAYELFKRYESIKKRNGFYDDCDLVFNLFQRLSKLDDINWCIHQFYIDEVQDFTQAELTLLLHCCRWPNGLFLTGDTAQSIMRGVSFRFSDLRSVFHYISRNVDTSKGQRSVVKVPCVHKLTQNFRSHSGILQLAASVIDLLMNFFRSSLDKLPSDQGMFPGPKPVLLLSCSYSDLALLLRGNRREASAIEFGARQAIIVQSDKAKEKLPSELRTGIVLTVFESKGLEFDDVLLYNFFADSKANKEWRVVTSYLHKHPELICQDQEDVMEEPRPLEFDERQHKMLNSELKFLYTALTRAKCNLWIYDSDLNRRAPMFHYFQKRSLVKVVSTDNSGNIERSNMQSMFAIVSTPEEWKKQGEYFKKKCLWDLAVMCFNKAGMPELACEAHAYSSVLLGNKHKSEPKKMREHFLSAAISFFKCLQLQQSAKWIKMAALCLFNAREYALAAPLFSKIRQDDHAIRAYQKCGKFLEVASIQQRQGNYEGAIQTLLSGKFFPTALEVAVEYSRNNPDSAIKPECSVNEVAFLTAGYYVDIEDRDLAIECVKNHFSNVKEKVSFFKGNHFIKEALEMLYEEQHYDDLYRLLKAQGLFSEGAEKCLQLHDDYNYCVFLLLLIKSKLYSSGSDQGENQYGKKARAKDVTELEKASRKIRDIELKIEIELFIGLVKKDTQICLRVCRKIRNQFGAIEALNAALNFSHSFSKSIELVLKCLGDARDVIDAFKARFLPEKVAGELLKFYGFEKSGDRYYLPPKQFYWLPELAKHSFDVRDSDGMIQLRESDVHNTIHEHIVNSAKQWLSDGKLDLFLYGSINSNPLNAVILKPDKDFAVLCSAHSQELSSYIKCCTQVIVLGHFYRFLESKLSSADNNFRSIDHMVGFGASRIVNIFSNQWNFYLAFSQSDFNKVRSSPVVCQEVNISIDNFLNRKQYKPTQDINGFLYKWLIHKVTDTSVAELENTLKEQEEALKDSETISPFLIEERKADSSIDYIHSFTMWSQACNSLVMHGNIMEFASKIIKRFILFNAKSESVPKISVLNAIALLEVVSIGLLGVLQASAVHLDYDKVPIILPEFYCHAIELFDNIHCGEKNVQLLTAASRTVVNIPIKKLAYLNKDSYKLLCLVIRLLVGLHLPFFNILVYALTRSVPNNGFERCFVLSMCLFANLAPLMPKKQYKMIHYNLCLLMNDIPNDYAELKAVVYRISVANNTNEIFHALLALQQKYNKGIISLTYNHSETKLEFVKVDATEFPTFALDPVVENIPPTQPTVTASSASTSSNDARFPVAVPSLPMRSSLSSNAQLSQSDVTEQVSLSEVSAQATLATSSTGSAASGAVAESKIDSIQTSPVLGPEQMNDESLSKTETSDHDHMNTQVQDNHNSSNGVPPYNSTSGVAYPVNGDHHSTTGVTDQQVWNDHNSATDVPQQQAQDDYNSATGVTYSPAQIEHQMRTLLASPNFNLFTFLLYHGMPPEVIQHHLIMAQQCLVQFTTPFMMHNVRPGFPEPRFIRNQLPGDIRLPSPFVHQHLHQPPPNIHQPPTNIHQPSNHHQPYRQVPTGQNLHSSLTAGVRTRIPTDFSQDVREPVPFNQNNTQYPSPNIDILIPSKVDLPTVSQSKDVTFHSRSPTPQVHPASPHSGIVVSSQSSVVHPTVQPTAIAQNQELFHDGPPKVSISHQVEAGVENSQMHHNLPTEFNPQIQPFMHSESIDEEYEQIEDYSEVYSVQVLEPEKVDVKEVNDDALDHLDKTFCADCVTHLCKDTRNENEEETLEKYSEHYASDKHKEKALQHEQYKSTLEKCTITINAAKDILATKKKCKHPQLSKKISSIDENLKRFGISCSIVLITAEWTKGETSVKNIITELTQFIQEYKVILNDILKQAQVLENEDTPLLDIVVPTKKTSHYN